MKTKLLFVLFFLLCILMNLIGQEIIKWQSPRVALVVHASLRQDKGYYLEGDTIDFALAFKLDGDNLNYYKGYQIDIKNFYFTGYEDNDLVILYSSFDSLIVVNDKFDAVEGIVRFKAKKFLNHIRTDFEAYVVDNNNLEIQHLIDEGEIPLDYPNLDWYRNHKDCMIISFSNNASVLSERRKTFLSNLDSDIVSVIESKLKIKNIHLILGATYGASYGFGDLIYFPKSTQEVSLNIQYRFNDDYFATGVFAQVRSYYNRKRTGFFTVLTGGFDYAKGKYKPFVMNPGGPSEDDLKKRKFEGIHPNITFGCGLSIGGSKFSRVLLFFDFGLKRGFANIYLSFVF